MNPLKSLYEGTVTRQLPYGGGSYSMPESPQYSPLKGYGAVDGDFTFGKEGWIKTPVQAQAQLFTPPAPAQAPQAPAPQSSDIPNSWMNPQTGQPYSAQEIVENMKKNMPMSSEMGDVGKYAGDAVMNPDESEEGLMGRARGMNNARNDISVGETDPYDITEGGSIVYSPQEREAIQKAYAGIYDPALNDVFARLKTREDEKKAKQDREDKIFATDENIRQWRATTGTKSSESDGETTADRFTQTQLNKGMVAAGMNQEQFLKLDPELANYYINPPKVWNSELEKNEDASSALEDVLNSYRTGGMTKEEAMEAIEGMGLSPEVTAHFLLQIPGITVEEAKKGFLKTTWDWIDERVNIFD